MNPRVEPETLNIRLAEVKAAMKAATNKRMYERYQCIFLYLSGRPPKEVATIIQRGYGTVAGYIRAYLSEGLEALTLDHSPGRPCRLTPEQEEELKQLLVEKRPADVGFPAQMNWNAPLVRDWIKQQFGVQYQERGVRDMLHRLGFSFTKPTYSLAKADPAKQTAFREEFEGVKKTGRGRN